MAGTVASAVLLLVKLKLTSAVGWVLRRIPKLAVPPDSLVWPLMACSSNPAVSLSVMVILPVVVGPKTMPALGLLIARLAVSSISSMLSSVIVKVTCPVVLPSVMVILLGIVPAKSADVAFPVNAKSTVWFPTTGRAAVAVTVILVVLASVPVVGVIDRLTASETVVKFHCVLPLIPIKEFAAKSAIVMGAIST